MKEIVILDNGHGEDTPGKRSPDGRLKEYQYCREIVDRIYEQLKTTYEVYKLVPEIKDISLNERVKRVNTICNQNPNSKIILVSIHVNAAGDGSKWMNANGWSVWISAIASENSKKFAKLLYKQCKLFNLMGNRSISNDTYQVANFAITTKTNCPAVLTENMFQDNKNDVEFLLSEKGKDIITKLHVNAINEYFMSI